MEGEVNVGGRKEENKVLGAGHGSVLRCPHDFCRGPAEFSHPDGGSQLPVPQDPGDPLLASTGS